MSRDSSGDWQSAIGRAEELAATARFADCLALCESWLNQCPENPDALLAFGGLLLNYGFLEAANACFLRGTHAAPDDLRFLVNIANVHRERGEHGRCRALYQRLLAALPDNAVVRRNALLSLEYDPDVSDAERLAQARAWGCWATRRAGGPQPRPPIRPLGDRRLRIGYVSADLCQHTVGLFVKDVMAAHDRERVEVFAYSAGKVNDWVTQAIRHSTTFRDVSGLNDAALAMRIRDDQVDVLVDLSGHTAGSRLIAFAHRPAPLQVSWLGYFATTGLPAIDAVLLDDWSAPQGSESVFTEAITRLPGGRFCYSPAPFSPEVSDPPCLANRHVSFGCFNNTAKLNAQVLEVWARILAAVPGSRLVLKWRTFQDTALRQSVLQTFEAGGVDASRIALRPASFHVDLLKEYADVDIALDPFPFNGGLTSCEALWMGVPLVTWPQSRVVSRQGSSFLSAIGLSQLCARSAADYVRIAAELAQDRTALRELRASLRQRMRASSLCDVQGFARRLEGAYVELYSQV